MNTVTLTKMDAAIAALWEQCLIKYDCGLEAEQVELLLFANRSPKGSELREEAAAMLDDMHARMGLDVAAIEEALL